MEAEGGTIECSASELLGAAYLSDSGGTEAGMIGFPLVLFFKPAHLGSLIHMVPTVLDGSAPRRWMVSV